MEFAYVKFVEGPDREKKVTIPVSEINYDFKKKDFQKDKKYPVRSNGKVYKAAIICMAETVDDLNTLIKSHRPKVRPSALMMSASDCSLSDDQPPLKRSKTTKVEKEEETKKKKNLDKYATLLNMKREKLDTLLKDKKSSDTESEETNVFSKSSDNTSSVNNKTAVVNLSKCDVSDSVKRTAGNSDDKESYDLDANVPENSKSDVRRKVKNDSENLLEEMSLTNKSESSDASPGLSTDKEKSLILSVNENNLQEYTLEKENNKNNSNIEKPTNLNGLEKINVSQGNKKLIPITHDIKVHSELKCKAEFEKLNKLLDTHKKDSMKLKELKKSMTN